MVSINNIENKKQYIGIIHRVYEALKKNKKKYIASTKTKSEVKGGGRKPWRQKGTGRARAGSIRSPLWVGGGVIFGPKPKKIEKKINKKEKKLATLAALSLKQESIENISSLQDLKNFLLNSNDKFNSDKWLLIMSENENSFYKENFEFIKLNYCFANNLILDKILNANTIIMTTESINFILNTYAKG